MDLRHAGPSDRDETVALWRRCGLARPWNDLDRDFDQAVAGGSSTVLIGTAEGATVASVNTAAGEVGAPVLSDGA